MKYKAISKDVRSSCVYALLYNEEIVYIGKTNSINVRIAQHKSDNTKDFDSYAVLKHFNCDSSSLEPSMCEAELITKYAPLYNYTFNQEYRKAVYEVANSNMRTRDKVRELVDLFPNMSATRISSITSIGVKTIYKHLKALGAENVRQIAEVSQDELGIDQWDSWVNGDGAF